MFRKSVSIFPIMNTVSNLMSKPFIRTAMQYNTAISTVIQFRKKYQLYIYKLYIWTNFFFSSLYFFTVTSTMTISTDESVTARCNEKVILYCNVTSEIDNFNVDKMQWVKSDVTLCDKNEATTDLHNSCNYTDKQMLALTIHNANESHHGTYICRITTDFIHLQSNTILKVSSEYLNVTLVY